MDYNEVITYLYEQIPMFQRIGKAAYKADLTNTILLCEQLGNPQDKFPTIHIAGTNGKGSSSHLIASVLQSAGYKVGLYTSPHLKSFQERIKINGQEIDPESIVSFVNENIQLIEKLKPSFFEITVAMAFYYFALKKVDIAVIEVGMGGRLDSTNIIQPVLSLITNISYDHQEFLGDTLPKIAYEKAGIIKKNTPIVISEYQKEVAKVFIQKAAEQESTLFFAEKIFDVRIKSSSYQYLAIDVNKNGSLYFEDLLIGLLGDYQEKNLGGVLQSIEILQEKGYAITREHIYEGIKNVVAQTGLKGRWQILQEKPLVICDTAHNLSGIEMVMYQLERIDSKNLHIVLGTLKDKDLTKILPLFPKEGIYYFCKPDVPRGLDENILKEKALEYDLIGEAYHSVNEAISIAKSRLAADDLLFIGGSTFVVAEIEGL